MRPGVEALLGRLEEGLDEPLVFIAPTGYGKTLASIAAAERLVATGRIPRLVHALPLRAILEQVYREALRRIGGRVSIGYQAMGLGYSGKSPFMAPRLVYTTYDSLLVNMLRGNVAERGLGHYEVPRAHLLSSLITLDEVHLGLGREGLTDTLYTVLYALRAARVDMVFETATLPPSLYRAVANAIGEHTAILVAPRPGCHEELGLPGARVEEIVDRDYYSMFTGMRWVYERVGSLEEGVRVAIEAVESGARALVVVDSVAEAARAYRVAREALGERAALVHSRMVPVERGRAVEEATSASREGRPFLLIGTSAVEAGVNYDADILVSSVPRWRDTILYSSLVQRMGRVCRARSSCTPRVYLVDAEEWLLEELRLTNPRLPCSTGGVVGYAKLLASENYPRPRFDPARLALVAGLLDPTRVEELARSYCDLVRGTPLVPLMPLEYLEEALEGRFTDYIFPVRFDTLSKLLDRLALGEKCARILRLEARRPEASESSLVVAEDCSREIYESIASGDCVRFARESERLGLVAILVEGYEHGVGLV